MYLTLGKFRYPIFWIIVLSIPAVWALFVPGFYGASDDLHIAWLHQMDKVLKIGQIPPRFVPDLSYGFGYPLFNFVFPLPFYLAEIFHLLSFSLVDSIKIVFILSVPFSGILMYFLLKEYINNSLSLAGAILYIYTPYRAVDLYVRGAIGEIAGFIFLPLIALSFLRLEKKGSLKWVGIGAISLACLILSHNITAYMFFPFILLLAIIQIFFFSTIRRRLVNNIFITIFLGFLISCYFWLPAILERNLVKYDTVFDFRDHFPEIRQLFTPYWGYGASVPGPYDGMSFFFGIINILVLVISIPFTILNLRKFEKSEKVILIWSITAITITLFLMNHRSTFIWNSIPLLPYFQFPWRFLTITTLFIPFLLISLKYIKINQIIYFFFAVLIIFTSWNYFKPQDFLGRHDSYYLNRYIPVPIASKEYKDTQEEYLRLPKDSQRRPDSNYPTVFSNNDSIVDVVKVNDLHFIVSVYSNEDTLLYFNKYYFPGWIAKLDGKKVEVKPGFPFGQISVSVPKGKHKLGVYFTETFYKLILDLVSLLGLLGTFGLIFGGKFIKNDL